MYKTSSSRYKDSWSSMYVKNVGSAGYRAKLRTDGKNMYGNYMTGPMLYLNSGESQYVAQSFFENGFNTAVAISSANPYGATYYVSIEWSPDV